MERRRIWICLLALAYIVSAHINTSAQVKTGIDVLAERDFDLLKGKRVGLVTNPNSTNDDGI